MRSRILMWQKPFLISLENRATASNSLSTAPVTIGDIPLMRRIPVHWVGNRKCHLKKDSRKPWSGIRIKDYRRQDGRQVIDNLELIMISCQLMRYTAFIYAENEDRVGNGNLSAGHWGTGDLCTKFSK